MARFTMDGLRRSATAFVLLIAVIPVDGSPGPQAADPASLIELLGSDQESVREKAKDALGAIGASAAPHLVRGLETPAWLESSHLLGRLGPAAEPWIPQLLEGLRRSDALRYAYALAYVSREAALAGLPTLDSTILHDEEPLRRFVALWALRRIGDGARASAPAVTHALQDQDERVRYQATQLAGQLRLPEFAPALRELLRDTAPGIQLQAGAALLAQGSSLTPEIRTAIEAALKPERVGQEVDRYEGLRALAYVGTAPPLADAVVGALRPADGRVRLAAAAALASLDRARAVPALPIFIGHLSAQSATERLLAVRGIAALGGAAKPARAALARLTGDGDATVRERAAAALRRLDWPACSDQPIDRLDLVMIWHAGPRAHFFDRGSDGVHACELKAGDPVFDGRIEAVESAAVVLRKRVVSQTFEVAELLERRALFGAESAPSGSDRVPLASLPGQDLVSVSFVNQEVAPVFLLYGQAIGINVVVHPSVRGRVTFRHGPVAWDRSFDELLASLNLARREQGLFFHIASTTELDAMVSLHSDPLPAWSGHPVSLDFWHGRLSSVLQLFADISGLGIPNRPDGDVHLVAKDVPWDAALDALLASHGLTHEVQGDTLLIGRRSVDVP